MTRRHLRILGGAILLMASAVLVTVIPGWAREPLLAAGPAAGVSAEPRSVGQRVTSEDVESARSRIPLVHTFSIVAHDPDTGEWGVAVQSKFIAVGSVVPYARAGVGAIATQSYANTTYGPEGLKLLAEGKSAQEVVKALTSGDEKRAFRQLGIVDAQGRAATFTGDRCNDWAGGRTGKHYTVQGNILAGKEVTDAMAETFEKAEGDLGDRMIAALAAGQKAGGDKRGKQSAALYIAKKQGGYAGQSDRYRDLRVDDHEHPIKELARIYALHKKLFPARRDR